MNQNPRKAFTPIGFRKAAPLLLVALLLSITALSCASKDSIRKQTYSRSGKGYGKTFARSKTHIVRKGETLSSIARRYRVSVSSLKKLNRIKDVRDIKIGTRLVIPGTSRKTRASSGRRGSAPKTNIKFIWPLKKVRVSSRFGIRSSKKHDGIDLKARKGTTIMAAAGGSVIYSGWGPSGYGRVVIIKHSRNAITVYAHNRRNLVRQGERVRRGQRIATVGDSGRTTGYHLHFELRLNRMPVDPERYLPKI